MKTMLFLRIALFQIALFSICEAVEIDPAEQPLVQIRFPLNDTIGDGAHSEIIYVLYKSGIGYSTLKYWQQFGGASSGANKNRKTFWLDQSHIDAAVAAARSFPEAQATVPPSQQIIIEGTAIEGGRIVSSWNTPGTKTLLLLTLFGGMRDELQKHFHRISTGSSDEE